MLHIGIELRLAIGFEIGAEALAVVGAGRAGVGVLDRAVGEEAADLEGAERVELAILGLDRRQHAGVEVRGEREVAVGRDLPVIGDRDLEALAGREAEVGHQPAGRRRPMPRDEAEDRQQRQVDAEQLQPAAFEPDALARGIVDHPARR